MTNEEIEIGALYWTRVRRDWIQIKVTGRTFLTAGGKRKRKAFFLENVVTGKEITPRRAGALHLTKPNTPAPPPPPRVDLARELQRLMSPVVIRQGHSMTIATPPLHDNGTIESYEPTAGRMPWPKPPEPPPGSCSDCGGSGLYMRPTKGYSFCHCPAGLKARAEHF